MLKLNSKAPNFSLPDQDGNIHSLNEYRDKWILVYFYPKDDTAGCTKEACVIRDNLPDFKKLNCVVLGISADSSESHEKFAKKYKLSFTLLADEEKRVIKKYGAWQKKKFMGREYIGIKRKSYLIDPDGKVAKIYLDVKPAKHAEEVLNDLKSLECPD